MSSKAADSKYHAEKSARKALEPAKKGAPKMQRTMTFASLGFKPLGQGGASSSNDGAPAAAPREQEPSDIDSLSS